VPLEHRDYEGRELPFGKVLLTEQNVDASAGYNAPGLPTPLEAYRAVMVVCTPSGADTLVTVRWRTHGAAGASEVTESQTAIGGQGNRLLFDAKGTTLQRVTFNGDPSVDYAIVETNQRPLPTSPAAGLTGTPTGLLYANPTPGTIPSGVVTTVRPTFVSLSGPNPAGNSAFAWRLVGGGYELQLLEAGLYDFTAGIAWVPFTGRRYLRLDIVNGAGAFVASSSSPWQTSSEDTPEGDVMTVGGQVDLFPFGYAGGAFTRMTLWQNSGVNRAIATGPGLTTCFIQMSYLPEAP
jgi:hypothetical protein